MFSWHWGKAKQRPDIRSNNTMSSPATFPCSVPGCNFVTPATCPQRHALDPHSFRQWGPRVSRTRWWPGLPLALAVTGHDWMVLKEDRRSKRTDLRFLGTRRALTLPNEDFTLAQQVEESKEILVPKHEAWLFEEMLSLTDTHYSLAHLIELLTSIPPERSTRGAPRKCVPCASEENCHQLWPIQKELWMYLECFVLGRKIKVVEITDLLHLRIVPNIVQNFSTAQDMRCDTPIRNIKKFQ